MRHLFVVLFSILFPLGFYAQSLGDSTINAIELHPLQFDKWLSREIEKLDMFDRPDSLEKIVASRFGKGFYTSTESVMSLLEKWKQYDRAMIGKPRITIYDIELFGSINYIDHLLSLLYKQPYLEMLLKKEKLWIIDYNLGKYEHPDTSFYLRLRELTDKIRKEVVITYYEIGNKTAIEFLKKDELAKAEDLLLKSLQYPYYMERDPKTQKTLFHLYVDAGWRLLKLRANDIEKLKDTYFVPSAKFKLEPLKKELIEKLEGK